MSQGLYINAINAVKNLTGSLLGATLMMAQLMAFLVLPDNKNRFGEILWQYNQNRLKFTAQSAALKRRFSLKATAWVLAILSKYRKFVQNVATKI